MKNKLIISCIFNFILFFSTSAICSQRIPIQVGSEVTFPVSIHNLNKIKIEGEKINSIKGMENEFEYTKDEETGEVFIKPIIEVVDKPIYIYLGTSEGSNYLLGLTTNIEKPQDIILVPINTEKKLEYLESNNSYEENIQALISAMFNQNEVSGFIIGKSNIKTPIINLLNIKPLQSYTGKNITGDILSVTNYSKEIVNISETDFYWTGIRAVSIAGDAILPPKYTVRVFLVR